MKLKDLLNDKIEITPSDMEIFNLYDHTPADGDKLTFRDVIDSLYKHEEFMSRSSVGEFADAVIKRALKERQGDEAFKEEAAQAAAGEQFEQKLTRAASLLGMLDRIDKDKEEFGRLDKLRLQEGLSALEGIITDKRDFYAKSAESRKERYTPEFIEKRAEKMMQGFDCDNPGATAEQKDAYYREVLQKLTDAPQKDANMAVRCKELIGKVNEIAADLGINLHGRGEPDRGKGG